jgi:predicted pyridoxine 5'-phosphate oxidase superfamily flavin-nucleotide-binding protein
MTNELTEEIHASIRESVLCWLATANRRGEPNVSPKEAFLADGDNALLVANIASPLSVKNIDDNPAVCVGFIDVFKQKGFKVKGNAKNLQAGDGGYEAKLSLLYDIIGEQYPIRSIIQVHIRQIAPIVAPSYRLFEGVTEAMQVESAMQTYNVMPRQIGGSVR